MKKIISKTEMKGEDRTDFSIGVGFKKASSLVDQIYKEIGRAIAKGELKPGQVLKESELQKAFGTSRAPIREAIRLLESDSMVIVDPYKKKYVRPITRRYLQDLIPVMSCLEGFAARIACDRITEEGIGLLKEKNKMLHEAAKRQEYDKCSELNFEFHSTYFKAADNHALNIAVRSMKKSHIWFWSTTFYRDTCELVPESIEDHNAIIQAFVKREPNKIEEEVRTHISKILELCLKHSSFDSKGFFVLPHQKELARMGNPS